MVKGVRVVSLLPAATEIVCALGFEKNLVGRSHECDYPPAVRPLPICSRPLIDSSASSDDIDRQIRDALAHGLSVFEIDVEVLRALSPDIVVTQTQCEVCAVSLQDVERALREQLGTPTDVVSIEPTSLDTVWDAFHTIGQRMSGGQRRSDALVHRLRERMSALARRTDGPAQRSPTVACIEWTDPLMAAGNWVPELVRMLGALDPLGIPGEHSPWIAWSDLRRADPEAIVVMPCGFDLERTRRAATRLTSHPDWPTLRAARSGRVAIVDGHQYFNRPGPRLVESLQILAEVLYPEVFPGTLGGTGWEIL